MIQQKLQEIQQKWRETPSYFKFAIVLATLIPLGIILLAILKMLTQRKG